MGLFKRVNQIRPNYSIFILLIIALSIYAGNLTSEFMDFPTFGFSKPMLIGAALGISAIITVITSYVATRF